jgi:hypothetical protein
MRTSLAKGVAIAVVLFLMPVASILLFPYTRSMSIEAGLRIGEEVVSAYVLDGSGATNRPSSDGTEDVTQYGTKTVVAYGRTDGSVVEVDLYSPFSFWYLPFAIGSTDFSALRVGYWSPSRKFRQFSRGADSKWTEDEL